MGTWLSSWKQISQYVEPPPCLRSLKLLISIAICMEPPENYQLQCRFSYPGSGSSGSFCLWVFAPESCSSLYFPACLSVFSSVQLLSRVRLFATPWITAHQVSLSITNSWSLLKPMSIESMMPSSHLILCFPLLLLPPIPPSIRVFSNESTLHIRWPKYWSFSFSVILPMNTQDWSLLGWTGWISLQSKGLSRVFSNTTVQKHQFFGAQLSLPPNSHIHTWPL